MRQFCLALVALLIAGTAWAQDEPHEVPRTDRVLTQADRAKMTPDDVLQALREGNQRYVDGSSLTRWNYPAQRQASATGGQYPKAVVLSCLDARIPVEVVFDTGIGDLFVARVAGNFENTDILGSMEFAGIHALDDTGQPDGVRLVVVMGHGSCGAVHHAIDRTRAGNIAEMLGNLDAAIRDVDGYKGDKTSKNREYVDLVIQRNVEITMQDIRRRSPILRDLEAAGQIQIVGALYDMQTGEVRFCEESADGRCRFEQDRLEHDE